MESGGAVTTVDAGTATPAESTSTPLSSDQIIDQAIESYASDETEGETPAEDAEAAKTDADEAPEQVEAEAKESQEKKVEEKDDEAEDEFAEKATPEAWKAALKAIQAKDPAVAKQIRAEHYQLAQFKEVISLDEARNLRSMFPTGEEAQQASRARADLIAMDETMRTSPRDFVGYLAENYPEQFAEIETNWPQWLHEKDPIRYRDSFARPMIHQFINSIQAMPMDGWDKDEVGVIVKYLRQFDEQHTRAGATMPQTDARDAKLREYEQRDAQRVQESIKSFNADVDREYRSKTREYINKALERAGATALTKEAKDEIVQKVAVGLAERLRSDPYAVTRLRAEARNGTRDGNHQRQVVDFLLKRIQPHVPQLVKENLQWVGKTMAKINTEQHDKERQASSRKPVVTGQAPQSRAQKVEWNKLGDSEKAKYRSRPEDLIDMAIRGELA